MSEFSSLSRVYIDTNIFVYNLERNETYFQASSDLLLGIMNADATIFTSEITIAECLYQPYKDNNQALINKYNLLFEESDDISIIPLSAISVKKASEIGALVGLKLIDAIHYTSAIELNCTHFISNDRRFRATPRLKILHL